MIGLLPSRRSPDSHGRVWLPGEASWSSDGVFEHHLEYACALGCHVES